MKKTIIILAIGLVTLVSAAIAFAATNEFMNGKAKPSSYNIGVTYDEAIASDKPFIGLFYVDWCGYCVRFMPKYKLIERVYRGKYNFVMINAEDKKFEKLAKDVAIAGLPSLFIFDPKYDNLVHINNGVYDDLGKLRKEFDRYLRIRAMIKN